MKKKNILFISLFLNFLFLSGCKYFLKQPPKTQPEVKKLNYTVKISNDKINLERLNKKLVLLEYKLEQIYGSINKLKNQHNKDITYIQSQLKALKEDQDAISKSLDSISSQIDNIEKRLSILEKRVNYLENSYFQLAKTSKKLNQENQKIKYLFRRNFREIQKEIAYLKANLSRIKKAIRKIPMIKIEEIKPTK